MATKAGVPQSVRRRLFLAASYRCVYPTPIEGVWFSIDHIFPRSLGGTSDESNLRVFCTRCNTVKGTNIEAGA